MLGKWVYHLALLLLIGCLYFLPPFGVDACFGGANPLKIQILTLQPTGQAEQIQGLVERVGFEFSPAPELAIRLRELGIKSLRLINVDAGHNEIVDGQIKASRLDQQLAWCKKVAAQPHIIIGQKIPTWLSTHNNDPKFGPRDWKAYDDYVRLLFQHVILEKGFRQATWEVANEPDIKGAPVPAFPRASQMGSEADYRSYLELYRHIAGVASQLEKIYGVKILLGGPAATLYSFTHGFNWYERFLRDVTLEKVKLDFLSFHYYGNISSIGKRRNLTSHPSFENAMAILRRCIAEYKPGLPIWITEWGPSYHTEMTPQGIINGNNVGAAWSAAFISAMLHSGVDRAFFLTADLNDNWGWPALFHGTTPKAVYYVFQMFQKLRGQLVEVQGGSTAIGALAAREHNRLALVVWNYNWQRGEYGGGQEGARQEQVSLKFAGLPDKEGYQVTRTQVSASHGNSYGLTLPEKKGELEPLKTNLGKYTPAEGAMALEITLPPSSVALLEIMPVH